MEKIIIRWVQWLKNHSCPAGQQRFLTEPLYNITNSMRQKIRKIPNPYLLLILVLALWLGSWYYIDFHYYKMNDRGTFGDKFGFINSLFSGLALAGIIYSIFLQQSELSLQSQELKETREEFKDQNFQTTFFNLLRTQQKIADDILASFSHIITYDKVKHSQIQGRQFFIKSKSELIRIEEALNHDKFIKYRLWTEDDDHEAHSLQPWDADDLFYERKIAFTLDYYKIDEESWNSAQKLTGLDRAKYLYGLFFNKYHFVIGHYFRHLYHILDFLDDSKRLKLEELSTVLDLTQKTKLEKDIIAEFNRYSNFVQAQLSTPEMFLTFYNSLSFPKMKKLVVGYNILENLPFEDLLAEEHNSVDGINLKSRNEILE